MRCNWLAPLIIALSTLLSLPAGVGEERSKTDRVSPAKGSPSAKPESDSPKSKDKAAKKSSDSKSSATPGSTRSVFRKLVAGSEAKRPDAEKSADKPSSAVARSSSKQSVAKKETKEEVKKATVVRFTLRGDYPEGPSSPGLFSELQPSLHSVIKKFDSAAEDPAVAAVWLRIEKLSIGLGKLHELQSAVERLKKAKKPVYAELASATTREYLLALACDEIVMSPAGTLMAPGVRAEVTFYKGLLDKIGVQFDVLQQGKFKGAAEPMTRTNMSPALRESMSAIVDDAYEDLVAAIAKGRKFEDYKAKTLIDEGLFTAAAAKKAGLIDSVLYGDELEKSLQQKLKVDKLNVVTTYKQPRVDTDFSGFSGMAKLFELMLGGKPAQRATPNRKIAVVYASGTIVEGKDASDLFSQQIVGSSTLISALRSAAENPKVAAVVLRIDSPGGSAVASDLIWREVVHMPKPVIASMGDTAASGGYYIAMGAKRIVAEPATLTGSIGVIGGKPVLHDLYDKLGISVEVISRGRTSGSLSTVQPFSDSEREAWTTLMQDTYRQFVDKAARGRKMSRGKLEKLAQGRVYSGRMALKNGLVDRLGTLSDAVAEAKEAAGIKADEKVDLLILPEPKSVFERLFGDPGVSGELDSILPDFAGLARQWKSFQLLLSEPILTVMPFRLELK